LEKRFGVAFATTGVDAWISQAEVSGTDPVVAVLARNMLTSERELILPSLLKGGPQ